MTLPPALRTLLWPAAVIFEAAVRLRALCYRRGIFRQKRLQGVVISVGNLTVGGTGKTPMVLWIAQRLFEEGRNVGILSRGYRGSTGTSDEVKLLKGRLEGRGSVGFGVGRDRYVSGRALERSGTNWFVLDDCFQHLRLARDVDIVLIDATYPFGGGRLLPAGRLREPKSALARADVVVITRAEHAPAVESIVRRYTPAPIFYAQTELESVRNAAESASEPGPADWLGKMAFAFCALGNTAAFFADLRRWSIHLVGQAAFRDHHRYTAGDADRLERQAVAAGAEVLICSEKDSYNMKGVWFKTLPVYACCINLKVTAPGEFWSAVVSRIERRRAGTAR